MERLYEYTEADYEETSMNKMLRKNREEHRKLISSCIRSCCSGNYRAKESIKELIYDFCLELFPERKDYLKLIPFDEPEKLMAWHQLEALIFYLDKENENQGQ